MLNKYVLMFSMFALSPANSSAADPNDLELQVRTRTFLQPLEVRFVLPSNDPLLPQFCARSGGAPCPPIVSSGGIPGGGAPNGIELYLPNVRVSFFVQEISHEVVANDGVQTSPTEVVFVNWTTTGSTAYVEEGGLYVFPLPEPGQTYDSSTPGFGPHGLLIYDALVLNACGSFSSFPVEHEGTITESGDAIGSFAGVDNSTIDSTGYYNLGYTIHAEDSDGGVSNFHIRGEARAICSGLNSL
jgi:hypothetical protein